jgi:hypothetical protein
MNVFWIGCASALLCVTEMTVTALAEPRTQGSWVTGGPHTHINVACFQVWKCDSGPVLHAPNFRVVTTPNKQTTGVCSAGSGPIDSCNNCVTAPPTEKCEYWLEPR